MRTHKSIARVRNTVGITRRAFAWRAWMLVTLSMAIIVPATTAKAASAIEYAIKGTYLFKFGAFVEWPKTVFSSPESPLVIGILGEDPFGSDLDQSLKNQTVEGRQVVLVRLKRVEQARDVHILFIGYDTVQPRESILADLRGRSVLTVTDKSGQHGGIITFLLRDNKVRFEIDLNAADQAGLKISSKLINLAVTANK